MDLVGDDMSTGSLRFESILHKRVEHLVVIMSQRIDSRGIQEYDRCNLFIVGKRLNPELFDVFQVFRVEVICCCVFCVSTLFPLCNFCVLSVEC